MAKQDFTQVNKGKAFQGIAAATKKKKERREDYTEEERAEIIHSMKTSGRKGIRMPRINMAFRPENYEYCYIMSRVSGKTLTDFMNSCVEEHRKNHKDIYEQALKFRNMIDNSQE